MQIQIYNHILDIYSRDQRRNESRFMSFTQYQDEISNQTNRVFYGTELTFDPKQFKAHTEVSPAVINSTSDVMCVHVLAILVDDALALKFLSTLI